MKLPHHHTLRRVTFLAVLLGLAVPASSQTYNDAISEPEAPIPVSGAVSRKTHNDAGPFDLNLPLTGTPGVERRSGGANGDHVIVITFGTRVTNVQNVMVTSGTGFVGFSQLTAQGFQYTVFLSGVSNAQRVTVTLFNVNDGFGNQSDTIPVTFGVLLGDTNGNGFVTASDIGQVKGNAGQPVTEANFTSDVNTNGAINASDIGQVKAQSGGQLP
jgi:hypothetical protein